MGNKLTLFRLDLLMLVKTKLQPVSVFNIFQNQDGSQFAEERQDSANNRNPVYRVNVRRKEKMADQTPAAA